MEDLNLHNHRAFIEEIIKKHIDAELVLTDNKDELNNKIGMSLWNGKGKPNLIILLSKITSKEISDHITALGVRGVVFEKPELNEYAEKINTPLEFLQHIVLHEIAHIKNNWSQEKETECDLWAYNASK